MFMGDDRRRALCRVVSYLVPMYAAMMAFCLIWWAVPRHPSKLYLVWILLAAHAALAMLIPTVVVALAFPTLAHKWFRALIAAGISLCVYVASLVVILFVAEGLGIRY